MTRVDWAGLGPYRSYPGKKLHNDFGVWAKDKRDLYFDGARMESRWAVVSDGAKGVKMENADGSTYFTFEYKDDAEMARRGYFTVDKGSVTVNGVSLTVCNPTRNSFRVAIIPFTMEVTNFCDIQIGSVVNIEFDILGKYIARLQSLS